MEETQLIIIPGEHFTKRELSTRLDTLGIPKPNSQDKNAYVELYNEAIKSDSNKRKLLKHLQFDSSNMPQSKQILNQCSFWNPTQVPNTKNKTQYVVQSHTISNKVQPEAVSTTNNSTYFQHISRPRLNDNQMNFDEKEMPRNVYYRNQTIPFVDNKTNVGNRPLVKKESIQKERQQGNMVNVIERDKEIPNRPTRNPFIYGGKLQKVNLNNSRLSNQNVNKEEEGDGNDDNVNNRPMNPNIISTKIYSNNSFGNNNNNNNTTKAMTQFDNERGNEQEETIKDNRFNQGIRQNNSFNSQSSFNQYDNNTNIQDEIIHENSFVDNSIIIDNTLQQQQQNPNNNALNRVNSQRINVNQSNPSINQYENEDLMNNPPINQPPLRRRRSQRLQLPKNAKLTNIKGSTTPSLSYFSFILIIIIVFFAFGPLSPNITNNPFVLLPLFFAFILLGVFIFIVLSYIAKKQLTTEVYQNLRGMIRDNANGITEQEIIRTYSSLYNMSETQFEYEVFPGLEEMRKKDRNIKLREKFIDDELAIVWQWDEQ